MFRFRLLHVKTRFPWILMNNDVVMHVLKFSSFQKHARYLRGRFRLAKLD